MAAVLRMARAMHEPHCLLSLLAVAAVLNRPYDVRMNPTLSLQDRSHDRSVWVEGHTPEFHPADPLKRRALERWENEGGKIPELSRTDDLMQTRARDHQNRRRRR